MIHKAKDLSPTQRIVVESLLGRSVSEDEAISIRTLSYDDAPDWLKDSWNSASLAGLSQMSQEEIETEIAATRSERHSQRQLQA